MSGFTEAVAILKSVNDLAQKIFPWDDSAASTIPKEWLPPQLQVSTERQKYILPYKPHQEWHSEKQSRFIHQWDQTHFFPILVKLQLL